MVGGQAMRFVVAFLFVFLPNLASAHPIAEVLKNPSAFDQQTVTVTGEVANVVTRYGEATSTTFDVLGVGESILSVLVSGVPKCKQGEVCRVKGLFVANKNLLLPETVERVAEGEYKTAGVLFHQRKESGGGSLFGGKAFRGVYIPQ